MLTADKLNCHSNKTPKFVCPCFESQHALNNVSRNGLTVQISFVLNFISLKMFLLPDYLSFFECTGLNENGPQKYIGSGTIRRYNLVGESGGGFWWFSSSIQAQFHSLPAACQSRCRTLSTMSACARPCFPPCQ